jgi:hypothetical protein
MKKVIKYFLILIIVLILIVVSIPFIFKGKIIDLTKEQINDNVNAKVDFGEFDLTVFHSFPDLTLYIKDVSVVGVDTFAQDTLMYFGKLSLDIDLMSVFGDNIKIKSISVDNPIINAIVLKNGKANWDIVPEDTTASEEDTTSQEESGGFSLVLKSFKINNADISYTDYESDMSTSIKDFNFELSGDFTESTTDLNLNSTISELNFEYDGIKYLKKAIAKFKAQIFADLDKSIYKFKDNQLIINDLPLTMEGQVEMPTDDIKMNLKLGAKGSFKKLLSLVPAVYLEGYENIKVNGNFNFETELKGVYNDSLMPAFDINLIVKNGSVKYPDLPEDLKNIAVDLNVYNKDSADLNKVVVNLRKFHTDIAGNPIDAKLVSTNVMVDPYIDAYLKTHLDLATLKKAIPLDSTDLTGIIDADVKMKGAMSSVENEKYEDFEAAGNLSIKDMIYKTTDDPVPVEIKNMDFTFAPAFLNLKDFYAVIGKSDFKANGKIFNFLQYYFRDSLLKGEFNFSSNLIDVNQWLTGEETNESELETTQVDTAASEPMELIKVPENIDFTLNTNIKKMYYDKLKIENIRGILIVKDGTVELKNLAMNVLGGTLSMNGQYSTKDINNPFASYLLNISGLDINKTYYAFETLQKVAPILKNSYGNMSGTLEISMVLNDDMSPKMKTMNGLGNIRTKNLVIKEAGIFKFMNSFFKTDKFKELKPKDTNLTIKIENGKISFSPFDFKVGNMKAHLQGEQYVDGGLNYQIDWTLPKNALGGDAVNVLNGLMSDLSSKGVNADFGNTISFKTLVLGTLEKPKYKVDMGDETKNVVDNVKQQVEDKVKEEIDKKKQEAIKKAKEEAAKLLEEANKKAKQIRDEAHKQAEKIRAEGKRTAQQIRDEAKRQGDKLIRDAKNPIAKQAAKATAKKLKEEADKKAAKVEKEANDKANKLEKEADKKAKKIVDEAKQQGDELIRKAENS